MILGVQDFYYNVADMQRALAFYRDVLGLDVLETSEYWSALSVGGLRLGLHGANGRAVPEVPRDAHGANAGGTLTLLVGNRDAVVETLTAAGVHFLNEAIDAEWGKLAVFQDPDGNVLKLMEPAH